MNPLKNLAGAIMGAHAPTMFRDAPELKYERPLKERRSDATVARLKADNAAKQARKSRKRQQDYEACKFFNPCYKIGKPSQKFYEYMRIQGTNKMFPMTKSNRRFFEGYTA